MLNPLKSPDNRNPKITVTIIATMECKVNQLIGVGTDESSE